MTTPARPSGSIPTFHIERWEDDMTSWQDWAGVQVAHGPYLTAIDAFAGVQRIRELWPLNEARCFRVIRRETTQVQVGEAIGPAPRGSSTSSPEALS